MGRDERPSRSQEALHSPPPEAPYFRIPEYVVRLRIASCGRKEKHRGSAQEDLRHRTLVLPDGCGGQELVGEDGTVVPIEPWYAQPRGVRIEGGLDEDVWDPPPLSLLIANL